MLLSILWRSVSPAWFKCIFTYFTSRCTLHKNTRMDVMNKVHSKALLQNTLEYTLLHKLHSGVQFVKYTLMYFDIKYTWILVNLASLVRLVKWISKTSSGGMLVILMNIFNSTCKISNLHENTIKYRNHRFHVVKLIWFLGMLSTPGVVILRNN